MLIPKSQLYADVVRCFSRNGSLGLGCTGIGSPMANYVGPNTSHWQGYKMASAMPADSSENLQLSHRNKGPELGTTARDRYIL